MKGALSMAKYERNPSARLSPRHARGEQGSPRQPRRKRIGLLAAVCLIALAGAVGIAAQAISGLLARSEKQTVSKTIVWQDNNNEEDLRPSPDPEEGESSYAAPTLTLTIGDHTYTSDSEGVEEALASLNMTSWPDYTITPTGSTWTLSYGKLETTVYELDENGELKLDENDQPIPVDQAPKVVWSLTPPEQEGYTLIDSASASGEYEGIEADTWYYLLEDTNTFTIDLRHGSLTNLQDIAKDIMEQFQLGASYSAEGTWLNIPFEDLEGNKGYADVLFEAFIENGDGTSSWEPWHPDEDTGEIPEELRLSIVAPKYTVNGEPITYRVSEIAEEGEAPDNKLDYASDSLEDGDHFAISYDNTASSNHSSDREGAYNGGSVILTLTGTVDYQAKKVWQDDADSSNRPGVELQLWRYRADQDLSSAAPVRDEDGGTYSITIEADSKQDSVDIVFTQKDDEGNPILDDNGDPVPVDFPKYDAEGYRYIYVVREYAAERAISGYDQVFGEIDENGNVKEDSDVVLGQQEDGTVTDTNTRAEGNTYLYNGGTLNNVLSGTVSTSATKVWEAPAFQAEFGDVSVEVTLQSKPESADDDAWANVQGEKGDVTATITDFTAENLSGVTITQSMPQYDGLGRELEYRWIETGVYQGESDDNLLEDGSFTLRQQEQGSDALRDVHYTSKVTYPTNEDGTASTLITNSVDGEISYDVDKWWELSPEEADAIDDKETNSNYKQHGNTWYTKEYPIDEDDADSATFYLYRVRSGEELNIEEDSQYLAFTMQNNSVYPDAFTTPEGDELTLEANADSPWHVTIEGLPEFDEDGRQYEYILVEQGRTPDYVTEREDGNYTTTVYNPTQPGDILLILVQKTWVDDSDTTHRLPVTIQAYNKKTGEAIDGAAVTLGEDGVWYDWLAVPLDSQDSAGGSTEGETGQSAGDTDEAEDSLGENADENTDGNSSPEGGNDEAGTGICDKDDIYLLETEVGDESQKSQVDHENDDYTAWPTGVTGDVTTQYHRYEVTYSGIESLDGISDNMCVATVTNRRLGNIDVEITKNWASGDNTQVEALQQALKGAGMSLALKLDFHESMDTLTKGYKIDYENGTVSLGGGENVQIYNQERNTGEGDAFDENQLGLAIIEMDLPADGTGKTTNYYFSNLPKFDTAGTIVRYTVEEGLQYQDGTFISFEDYRASETSDQALLTALNNWSMRISQTDYKSAIDMVEANSEADKDVDYQEMTANNRLVGTKEASWHKLWKDAYRYDLNQRPDIYLDIYRVVHTSASGSAVQIELYQADYRWTAKEDDGTNSWTATITGLPKYDEYGYEITYYAVERTAVNAANFDYGPVQYLVEKTGTKGLTLIGDRVTVNSEDAENSFYVYSLKGDVYDIGGKTELDIESRYSVEVNYALAQDGTFQNTLQANPILTGQKLWNGVPSGFAMEDLPQVTFALYRQLADKDTETPEIQEVATLTVADWASAWSNGSYQFQFLFEGNWTMSAGENNTILYTNNENPSLQVTVNADGTLQEPLPEGVDRLPNYDSNGNLYAYSMREQSITLTDDQGTEHIITLNPDGTPVDGTDGTALELFNSIFQSVGVTQGTYRAENQYKEDQDGQVKVQKWLKLEMDKEGNWVYPAVTVELYRTYANASGEPELVATHTWDSEEVENIFTTAADTTYADTGWVLLDPHTFTDLPIYAVNGETYQYYFVENKDQLKGYDTWVVSGSVGYGSLQGAMIDDNEGFESAKFPAAENTDVDATFINQYHTPTIALQGTKEWQDWENNNFRPKIVNGKVDGIKLTVTRTAASQDGQNNDLSETLVEDEDYVVTWDVDPDNQDQWIYMIKAKEGNSGELAQYAPNGMPWTYTVKEELSGGLEDIYSGGNKKVTINGGNAKKEDPDGDLVASAGQNLVNSMRTSAVFQKVWQDENGGSVTSNYLGNVTITYALQVRGRNSKDAWQDASEYFSEEQQEALFENGYKFERELTAYADADSTDWKDTFDDLPTAIITDSSVTPAEYTLLEYRVVERTIAYTLPGPNGQKVTVTVTPPADGEDGRYNFTEANNSLITGAVLSVLNGTSTSTNTLATVDLDVTKAWVDDGNRYNTRPEGNDGNWSVTFLVQYSTDSGTTWSPFLVPNASGDGTPLTVTVTGSDANNSGTQTVHDLPAVSTWQYRAVELDSDYAEENIDNIQNYIVQEGEKFNTGYKTRYGDNPTTEKNGEDKVTKYKSSATNTLLTTSVSVEKQWTANTPEDGRVPVQMEVQYLAADGTTWRPISGTRVTLGEGENPAWTHTWSDLPQYMPGSDTTTGQTQYQVVEISGDGYEQVESTTDGTGTDEDPFVITNKAVVDYTVEKVWNGVPADVNGWSVTVQLYRSANGVRDETYSQNATLPQGNSWRHTFEDLDKYDSDREEYTYYAEEISVTVDDKTIPVADDAFTVPLGDGTTLDFAVDYDRTSEPNTTIITNRTAGQITVTKLWWDEGGETSRPEFITVGLYIRVGDQLNAYPSPDDHYTITLEEEKKWAGTFEDLPEYDSNGNKITYVVRELKNGRAVEESGNLGDYTVHYGGTGKIHNFRYANLTLEKVLLGAAANPDKEFHFTVELEYPEGMPHGESYTYQISESDGPSTPEVGTISSEGGVIILKGGQYAAINGLPAGTKYTITETEANEDGYTTCVTVNGIVSETDIATGTVSVAEGAMNSVIFTNVRDPGTLIVAKRVTGYGNTGKDWHFTIQLTGPDGQLWKDSVKAALSDGTTVELEFNGQGEAAFTLKHGQTLRIDGLPNGTAYQVTETEANRDGYTTTKSGDTGAITGNGSSTAQFVNYKPGGGGGRPTPTPGPTESPAPSESPTPSESPEPSGSPAPSESPEPSGTPDPSGTPGPSASPVPSGTPAVSQSPSPTGTPEPGDTPDDTPTTGDPTHTGLWLGLGGLSLGALVLVIATRPKGKRPKHYKK